MRHAIVALAFLLPGAALAQEDMMMHMQGAMGPHPMTREASGTAWVPDSSPMEGIHAMPGDWMTMVHGYIDAVYDDQDGPRGDSMTFSESMLMAMAQHPLGEGTFGLRTMLSLDPLMGKRGYPLLLQTGETANGTDHLVDRQHPHDLFMELATTYSHPIGDENSVFVYVGYPGEPALGPPTFMHRFSGMDNPEAPITHHWLDSTHITFGVATLGATIGNWKVEGSSFTGREPDQYRWNFDDPKFDSWAGRLTYNPNDNWSMQVSYGYIHSPEQLEPDIDQHRTTASIIYNHPMEGRDNWQTTFAWGRNSISTGHDTDAFLLESAVRFREDNTIFGRAERVEKDELFDDPSPLAGDTFLVNKLSIGYIRDVQIAEHAKVGIGGVGSVYALPSELDDAYGDNPVSFMIFLRAAIN